MTTVKLPKEVSDLIKSAEVSEGKCTITLELANGEYIEIETLGIICSFRVGRNRAGEKRTELL